MNVQFKGVYPVAVTPFHRDGSFDFTAAKANADALIDAGVHGICILGATGEYMSITNEEHKAYIRELVPYLSTRTSVLVGVTRERTEEVIELIRNAKECGAHAAMVLSPYYCHPSQDEIFAHFAAISEAVDFPVIVYNNPGSAGVTIEPETFEKILKLPNMAIVKESTGDIKCLTKLLLTAPPQVSVFCGCDNMSYESFAVGAHGWISMLANIAPKSCVALYNAIVVEKDTAKGLEIYRGILPALNVLESFAKPVQALKYILTEQGRVGGFVRRPRQELTQQEKEYVDAEMHPRTLS